MFTLSYNSTKNILTASQQHTSSLIITVWGMKTFMSKENHQTKVYIGGTLVKMQGWTQRTLTLLLTQRTDWTQKTPTLLLTQRTHQRSVYELDGIRNLYRKSLKELYYATRCHDMSRVTNSGPGYTPLCLFGDTDNLTYTYTNCMCDSNLSIHIFCMHT